MQPEEQERLVVVLVRARNPSNIGAAARAMHDLGFSHLRIVNEFPVPFAAAKSAVDASSVLNAAGEFVSVADAVADCNLVLGTTAVGERALEHPLHLLPEAAKDIRNRLTQAPTRVALLFGSEKTGLSNDELSYCHGLVTIPMNSRTSDRHLSMNLGQAVAVCLYAVAQAPQPQLQPSAQQNVQARADEVERVTSLLQQVLQTSGYARRHPANCREDVLRRLIRRMRLSPTDAAVWTGILRQFGYALAERAPVTEPPPHSSHEES